MKSIIVISHFVRLQALPVTISVLLVGALSTDSPITLQNGFDLFILGIFVHLFGFGLNDIVDLPIDRLNPHRQNYPLVNGEIPRNFAHCFVWAQPVLALIWIFKPTLRNSNPALVTICLFSILLSIVYNLWGKRGRIFSVIAELSLAGSISLLLLAGAYVSSSSPSPRTWLLAIVAFIFLHQANSIPSGLKDLKTDLASGARTFIIRFGARMVDADSDRIFIPPGIKRYAIFLQLTIVSFCIVLVILFNDTGALWQLVLSASSTILLSIAATIHLHHVLNCETYADLRYSEPALNLFLNYSAILTALFFRDPLYFGAFLFLSLPIATYRVIQKRAESYET